MPPAARGHQTLSAYISSRFDEFSRSQKDVAQYVVDHLDEVAFHTAEELARRASTSSSTVVRFSQALGFEGFPELQEAAREEYRHHHRDHGQDRAASRPRRCSRSTRRRSSRPWPPTTSTWRRRRGKVSRSEVDGAIEAIATADRILIAGTDQMAFFASYLRHLLMLLDMRAEIAASPSQEALSRLGRIDEGTLVIGLSAGRPHPLVVRAMKIARHRKALDAGDRRRDALGGLQAVRADALLLVQLTGLRALARRPAVADPGARLRRLLARRGAVRRPHPRLQAQVARRAEMSMARMLASSGSLASTSRMIAVHVRLVVTEVGQHRLSAPSA